MQVRHTGIIGNGIEMELTVLENVINLIYDNKNWCFDDTMRSNGGHVFRQLPMKKALISL